MRRPHPYAGSDSTETCSIKIHGDIEREKCTDDPQETYAKYTVPASSTALTETRAQRKLAYGYDGLGRLSSRTLYADEAGSANRKALETTYGYAAGGQGANSTTGLVSRLTQGGLETQYAYDAVGNITSESILGLERRYALSLETEAGVFSPLEFEGQELSLSSEIGRRSYAYDALGQLTRANVQEAGSSWTYAYDQGGNLQRKVRYGYTEEDSPLGAEKESVAYTYGDANWKDKLTAYDGKAITYDAIGNPLSYDGKSFVWRRGRQLASVVDSATNQTVRFTYDYTGMRIAKENENGITRYTYNGTKLTYLKNEEANVQIHFYYDAQGRASILRYNGVDYAYVHNLQGDVTRIVDMDGNTVVEYAYDPWGRLLGTHGSLAGTVGYWNPLRYRGYVYDEETGLYWLRSRYYQPEWGRFLNADTLLGKAGVLLSHSIFVYCYNNPVSLGDSTGQAANSAVLVGVKAGIMVVGTINRMKENREKTPGIENLDSRQINDDFSKSEYSVTVTDLITGKSWISTWAPKYSREYPSESKHADSWPSGVSAQRTVREIMNSVMNTNIRVDTKRLWDDESLWSTDARPVMITAIDDHGKTRHIAHGWIPFPHKGTFDNFNLDGEMCMYNGFDVSGSETEQGNAAAIAAYYGVY